MPGLTADELTTPLLDIDPLHVQRRELGGGVGEKVGCSLGLTF